MKKIGIIILILILALVGLSFVGNKAIAYWEETDIPCLPNGHQNVDTHIHPQLTILVDGEQELIEANVGVIPTCMAEVHTHDQTGSIHIETVDLGVVYTLSDFFDVWDKEIEREGYTYTIVVDGEEASDGSFTLVDHQDIQIIYTSVEG